MTSPYYHNDYEPQYIGDHEHHHAPQPQAAARRSGQKGGSRPHKDSSSSSARYRHEDRGYHYSSRPSSRSGSVYEDRYFDRDRYAREYVVYHNPPMAAGYHAMPYMQPMAVMPDRQTVDAFEKHWRYYQQHPHLYEELRITNPAQFDNLNNYYKMCGNYLRLAPILPSIKQEHTTSSSRASVHSGQSSSDVNDNQAGGFDAGNESIPPYDDQQDQVLQSDETNELSHMAPVKFSSAHVKGAFGVRGNIAKIMGKSVKDGVSATIELHSIQPLMGKGVKELQDFPGPLVPGHTHKSEVIQFCQNRIANSHTNPDIVDKDSYNLMWELLILLLRQKNSVDGSDIAELLLRNYDAQTSYNKTEAVGNVVEDVEHVTAKFRDYLLFGHKREGLEYAMNHGLWGHALFLASKMDDRAYSNVMLRFANGLAVNDPLQTLYQLMSGRQPISVKECADKSWGDWRPHLAMILSNPSTKEELDRRSVLTLGDSLLEKGFLFAAHFCYLMINVEFTSYSEKNASKMVLIGSDKSLPFDAFATDEAIQCTEIFEYVQKLSNPNFSMNTLTYFKFIYALRLVDHGLPQQALHYLEQLADTYVREPSRFCGDRVPANTLIHQVLDLSDRLKYLDPMYTTGEGEITEMSDPVWLQKLRNACMLLQSDAVDHRHENHETPDEVGHSHMIQSQEDADRYHGGPLTQETNVATTSEAVESNACEPDDEQNYQDYNATHKQYYNLEDNTRPEQSGPIEPSHEAHSTEYFDGQEPIMMRPVHHDIPYESLPPQNDNVPSKDSVPSSPDHVPIQEHQPHPPPPPRAETQSHQSTPLPGMVPGMDPMHPMPVPQMYQPHPIQGFPDPNYPPSAMVNPDQQVQPQHIMQPLPSSGDAAPQQHTFYPHQATDPNHASIQRQPQILQPLPIDPSSHPQHTNYFSNIQTTTPGQDQEAESAKQEPVAAATEKSQAEDQDHQKKDKDDKDNANADGKKNSSGMFGRIFGRFIKPSNQMHLPEDKDQGIVWDEEKKRWVDKNSNEEEESSGMVAPPSDVELSRNNSTADFGDTSSAQSAPGPPALQPPMGNRFVGGLAKKRGGLAGRVDIFKNSQSVPVLFDPTKLAPMPSMQQPQQQQQQLFQPPMMAPAALAPNIMMPTGDTQQSVPDHNDAMTMAPGNYYYQ